MEITVETAMPWLLASLAVLGIVALIALIVVLVKVAKAVSGVNELVETANKQLSPTLQNVNAMVEGVTPSVQALGPAL